MTKPKISSAFTVDEIHKVREWNYERHKGMTKQEAVNDINRAGERVQAEIDALRRAAKTDGT